MTSVWFGRISFTALSVAVTRFAVRRLLPFADASSGQGRMSPGEYGREQGSECMNTADIAGRLAGWTGLGEAQASSAVEAMFAAIGEALAEGEDVRVAGFGTFAVKNRPARAGRNPRTGEAVSIPASTVPSFKAAKALRNAVNGG